MPEGPEIRLAADRVGSALIISPAVEVYFAFDHLETFERSLAGTRVMRVETFGMAH